jgi:hypothetical protein
MQLYPKRLRNIDDLERERKLVLKQKQRLEKEDLFSSGESSGKKGSKTRDKEEVGGGALSSLIGLLPIGNNPLVGIVVGFAEQYFAGRSERRSKKAFSQPNDEGKKHKNVLGSLAVEFIGGYLKWKAIELSYKGIKLIIKKNKEKKAPATPY